MSLISPNFDVKSFFPQFWPGKAQYCHTIEGEIEDAMVVDCHRVA